MNKDNLEKLSKDKDNFILSYKIILFDELFLEISEYNSEKKGKNPFDGPSTYNQFYTERSIKAKKKIYTAFLSHIQEPKY